VVLAAPMALPKHRRCGTRAGQITEPSTQRPALKFDELRSIAHNLAESFASGGILVLPTSFGTIHVFTEARRSPEGYIAIDFLSGRSAGARPSPSLARAIEFYGDALADLCGRHGTSPSAFRELTARYSVDKRVKRFVVTTADHHGRLQVDEYMGMPGKRVRTLKRLGRVPSKKSRPSVLDVGSSSRFQRSRMRA
jgi:hypothetical protein